MIIYEDATAITFEFEWQDSYCAQEFLRELVGHGELTREGKAYVFPSSSKEEFYKLKEQFFGYEKEDMYNRL